jgi:hypothetical protein
MRLQNRGVTRVSPAIDADPASTCRRAARVVADQVAVPRETLSGRSAQSRAAPAARQTEPASPRCCREMALERAESSAVVSVARRQRVDKARKIRWLTYGRVFRPGKVGLPARVLSLIP